MRNALLSPLPTPLPHPLMIVLTPCTRGAEASRGATAAAAATAVTALAAEIQATAEEEAATAAAEEATAAEEAARARGWGTTATFGHAFTRAGPQHPSGTSVGVSSTLASQSTRTQPTSNGGRRRRGHASRRDAAVSRP